MALATENIDKIIKVTSASSYVLMILSTSVGVTGVRYSSLGPVFMSSGDGNIIKVRVTSDCLFQIRDFVNEELRKAIAQSITFSV